MARRRVSTSMADSLEMWVASILGLLSVMLSSTWLLWSFITIAITVGLEPQVAAAQLCAAFADFVALPVGVQPR